MDTLEDRYKRARRGRLTPPLSGRTAALVAVDVAELVLCCVPEGDDRARAAITAARQSLAGEVPPRALWDTTRAAERAACDYALAGRQAAAYASFGAWGAIEAAVVVAESPGVELESTAARQAASAAARAAWAAEMEAWVAHDRTPAKERLTAIAKRAAVAVDPDVIAAIVRRHTSPTT